MIQETIFGKGCAYGASCPDKNIIDILFEYGDKELLDYIAKNTRKCNYIGDFEDDLSFFGEFDAEKLIMKLPPGQSRCEVTLKNKKMENISDLMNSSGVSVFIFRIRSKSDADMYIVVGAKDSFCIDDSDKCSFHILPCCSELRTGKYYRAVYAAAEQEGI